MSDRRLERQARSTQGPVHIPWALLADRRLNLNDLRVLLVLYAFADASGESRPTRDTLATITGLPASRVSTVTSRLAAMGWLEKHSGSGKSTTSYRLYPIDGAGDFPARFSTPAEATGVLATSRSPIAAMPVASDSNLAPRSDTASPATPPAGEGDPDLQREIQRIVREELTRLNGAGHLAGDGIAPEVKLRLKRFRREG
ncbi:MAG: helix-turn-helix domain-containing protein [Magnetococcales bacterium]|nr:helix-turn-helix domain-containing protein [Magnetococcales bacterium]